VGDAYYPEQMFLDTFNEAALAAINSALGRACTERGLFRALRNLRDTSEHQRVLAAALVRVEGSEWTRGAVSTVSGRVVARFPCPLDKRTAAP
jgi:hypothetical protein